MLELRADEEDDGHNVPYLVIQERHPFQAKHPGTVQVCLTLQRAGEMEACRIIRQKLVIYLNGSNLHKSPKSCSPGNREAALCTREVSGLRELKKYL